MVNFRASAYKLKQVVSVKLYARKSNTVYFEICLSMLMRHVIWRNFDRAHEVLAGVADHQTLEYLHTYDHQFRRIFGAMIVECNP